MDPGKLNEQALGELKKALQESDEYVTKMRMNEFRALLADIFGMKGHPKEKELWDYAWEEGHASGYYSVVDVYEEIYRSFIALREFHRTVSEQPQVLTVQILKMKLCFAARLRILEILSTERGVPSEEDFSRAEKVSKRLGERGDLLLYGGGEKGEVASLFNDTAFAIAVLAFAPGGVEVFGERFEATTIKAWHERQ